MIDIVILLMESNISEVDVDEKETALVVRRTGQTSFVIFTQLQKSSTVMVRHINSNNVRQCGSYQNVVGLTISEFSPTEVIFTFQNTQSLILQKLHNDFAKEIIRYKQEMRRSIWKRSSYFNNSNLHCICDFSSKEFPGKHDEAPTIMTIKYFVRNEYNLEEKFREAVHIQDLNIRQCQNVKVNEESTIYFLQVTQDSEFPNIVLYQINSQKVQMEILRNTVQIPLNYYVKKRFQLEVRQVRENFFIWYNQKLIVTNRLGNLKRSIDFPSSSQVLMTKDLTLFCTKQKIEQQIKETYSMLNLKLELVNVLEETTPNTKKRNEYKELINEGIRGYFVSSVRISPTQNERHPWKLTIKNQKKQLGIAESLRDVFMQMLLHVNEEFDDDFLLDAINLMSQN